MRIGVIYTNFYPLSSSASAHGYYLFSHLSRYGYELHTLGMGKNPLTIDHPADLRGLLSFSRNIDILYIRLYPWRKRDWLTLLKLIRFRKLKVIWEVNAPVEEVLSHHQNHVPKHIRDWIRRENRKLTFLARFCDGAIGVSHTMQKYCSEFLNIRRSISIPNGSDPSLFKKREPEANNPMHALCANKFVVAWAGRTSFPWQGINLLLEVAEKMQNTDPDVVFITFSETSLYNRGILPNLYALGEVRNDLLPAFLSFAHVGLCLYNSYDWSPFGFYGSSLKLFDYLSMELVVIASNMGQISEVIEDGKNGFLTDNTTEDIIHKIRYARDHYNELEELRSNARKVITEEYNWENVARKTAEFLKECTQ